MRDMGQTMDQMYPSSSDEKSIMHPNCSVPTKLFSAQPRVGEKVHVEFECVDESISKSSVQLKMLKGEEVESGAQEKTEDESLLGKK